MADLQSNVLSHAKKKKKKKKERLIWLARADEWYLNTPLPSLPPLQTISSPPHHLTWFGKVQARLLSQKREERVTENSLKERSEFV